MQSCLARPSSRLSLKTTNDYLEIKYYSIRNITSPEDKANERAIYAGQMPIAAVIGLPTDENVRQYLADAEGKKSRKPTDVHIAIKDTIKNNPEMFSVLNGGLVIVARDYEIDEKSMTIKLLRPSIINGAQTQGVIKDLFAEMDELPPIHIKFELIVSSDTNLMAEISIARNFQNNVESVSILGARQVFDDLEISMQDSNPNIKLQKSESQRPTDDGNILDTLKILQVIAALLPETLHWKKPKNKKDSTEIDLNNKVYTYNRKATCLGDFQEIWRGAKDVSHPNHQKLKEVYAFYLTISNEAFDLYKKWKAHQGFKGTALRAIVKDENSNIVEVPDGIIFPIIAAHSVFCVNKDARWTLKIPRLLSDDELIQSAKSAYMEIAKSKPQIMGTTKACYSQIEQLTRIYKNLAG